ncbi:hypothetical protein HFN51_03580 [Rhizobium leguminosarum]|nr:hypothetical protein [Rhizobium leguminosarum]
MTWTLITAVWFLLACATIMVFGLSGRISREEEEGRYSSGGNVVPFRLRQRRS